MEIVRKNCANDRSVRETMKKRWYTADSWQEVRVQTAGVLAKYVAVVHGCGS